ncbi:MAG: IgGFc-binding protein [Polyangiales bacterium]
MTTRRATVLFFSLLISLAACGDKDRPAVNSAPPSIFDAGYRYVDAAPTCTAMGTLCDGQTPYRCVDNARVAMEPCAGDRPFCAPGIGCLGCLPESLRCNPDRPEVPQRCATDGSRWIDQTACDASMGQRCTDGRCGDPCAVPDGVRPYLGCSYWATQTPNSQLYSRFPFAVALANPQSFEVSVRISGGALTDRTEATLAAGEVRAITLPWVQGLVQFNTSNPGCTGARGERCAAYPPGRSGVVQGGAYHIESTAPVAAYQFNPLTFQQMTPEGRAVFSFTNDASLLLSQRSLTQRYLVLTAPNWVPPVPAGTAPIAFGGFIAVTAITGETTSVTVRLPTRHGVSTADATGVIERGNLMPGDVALIVGDTSGDLSGAIVEASAPVAVYAGHDCTNVPQSRPACDHLEEQVLPIEALGRDYVIADLRDRRVGSVVRMVAPSNDTVVRFDPPSVSPSLQMRAGEVVEILATGSFRVVASKPILVAQFMMGQGSVATDTGDPAMVYEVPTQQFRDRYDVLVPDTYLANYFGVVAPRGTQVLLDGAPLGGMSETLGPWTILHAPVTPGRHQLRTREGVPLGVKVYGTATYTSYMYPGGLDLRLLPPG